LSAELSSLTLSALDALKMSKNKIKEIATDPVTVLSLVLGIILTIGVILALLPLALASDSQDDDIVEPEDGNDFINETHAMNMTSVCLWIPDHHMCNPDEIGNCPSNWAKNDAGKCFPVQIPCPTGYRRADTSGACVGSDFRVAESFGFQVYPMNQCEMLGWVVLGDKCYRKAEITNFETLGECYSNKICRMFTDEYPNAEVGIEEETR
jgi:hypothetical protein